MSRSGKSPTRRVFLRNMIAMLPAVSVAASVPRRRHLGQLAGVSPVGGPRNWPASLVDNETVNAEDPISLIHIVLAGSAMPSTHTAPSAFAMPAFGWRLSDAEVADVLSFVRQSWGNHSPPVNPAEVGHLRKAIVVE